MTPKEKAEELVGKYYFQVFNLNQQKQCALIDINKILSNDNLYTELFIYYSEVKREIEKL